MMKKKKMILMLVSQMKVPHQLQICIKVNNLMEHINRMIQSQKMLNQNIKFQMDQHQEQENLQNLNQYQGQNLKNHQLIKRNHQKMKSQNQQHQHYHNKVHLQQLQYQQKYQHRHHHKHHHKDHHKDQHKDQHFNQK